MELLIKEIGFPIRAEGGGAIPALSHFLLLMKEKSFLLLPSSCPCLTHMCCMHFSIPAGLISPAFCISPPVVLLNLVKALRILLDVTPLPVKCYEHVSF